MKRKPAKRTRTPNQLDDFRDHLAPYLAAERGHRLLAAGKRLEAAAALAEAKAGMKRRPAIEARGRARAAMPVQYSDHQAKPRRRR